MVTSVPSVTLAFQLIYGRVNKLIQEIPSFEYQEFIADKTTSATKCYNGKISPVMQDMMQVGETITAYIIQGRNQNTF